MPKKNFNLWFIVKMVLCTVEFKEIVRCTLYCKVFSVICAVCHIQFAVFSVQYAVCSVNCTVCSVQCTVF